MCPRPTLSSKGLRGLSPHEQAMELHFDFGLSMRQASTMAGIDRHAGDRAKRSLLKVGRSLGQAGPTEVITALMKGDLEKLAATMPNVTLEKARQEVGISTLSLLPYSCCPAPIPSSFITPLAEEKLYCKRSSSFGGLGGVLPQTFLFLRWRLFPSPALLEGDDCHLRRCNRAQVSKAKTCGRGSSLFPPPPYCLPNFVFSSFTRITSSMSGM